MYPGKGVRRIGSGTDKIGVRFQVTEPYGQDVYVTLSDKAFGFEKPYEQNDCCRVALSLKTNVL
jgi:hypothetical protein